MICVAHESLKAYIREIFEKVGLVNSDAIRVSQSLVLANLRGIDSHGILRVPIYVQRLQKGLINITGQTTFDLLDSSFVVADGHNRLGQIVAFDATKKLVKISQDRVISGVLIRNSNHFGEAAEYAIELANNGLIGIVVSNSVALMPAIGGAEKVIGNNPMAVSFASDKYGSITLDMALSQVAQGKVRLAFERGDKVPFGWGADCMGEPTDDPERILNDGFLLPAAGPKGFGLALTVEVLTSVLSGMQVGKQIASIYQLEKEACVSHFLLAINPGLIIRPSLYQQQLDSLIESIRDSKKAPNTQKIYLPGEIELETQAKRTVEGIPVDEAVYEELVSVGSDLGVCAELTRRLG